MSINYIPFESKSGFKSPGFTVDEVGNVVASSLVISNFSEGGAGGTSTLQVDDLYVNGVQILEGNDGSSVFALGNNITASSLTKLGILTDLSVVGDISITHNNNDVITVVDGVVTIESQGTTGTLDNFNIGSTVPAAATFTNTTISTLSATSATVGTLSATGNISSSTAPTIASHLTRKDYVDNRISAFAVAFGA